MEFRVEIRNSAKSDLKKIKLSHLQNEFAAIIRQLKKNPFAPNQSFEKLRPPASGKYSRRINLQHRLVYTIDKEQHIVYVWAAWSHYGN